jgi:hypothetical protein
VRLRIVGRTAAHARLTADPEKWTAELRSIATDVGADSLWLERVRFQTEPELDLKRLAERSDAVGQIARRLQELRTGREDLGSLVDELSDLQSKLPRELRETDEGVLVDDESAVVAALDDVERLLLPRLLDVGGEE